MLIINGHTESFTHLTALEAKSICRALKQRVIVKVEIDQHTSITILSLASRVFFCGRGMNSNV